ncbi:thiol:disulfide interchange protein DsbA [Methylothermus subterraneus]
MRYVWTILLGWLLAGAVAAQEYVELNPPRPTADPTKIEVIEFFWYGCPHCFRFDPYLEDWLKSKPAEVAFRRQPVIFGPHWAPQARAYFTAEVLGVVDKIHKDFFDAMHVAKKPMASEEELAEFFVAHGVDRQAFQSAFRSFAVDLKVRQAEAIAADYGITGVPSLVVNGKYAITGQTAKTYAKMIEALKTLVERERQALRAGMP